MKGIVIDKKKAVTFFLAVLSILLVAGACLGVLFMEAWLYHRAFPDPGMYPPINWPEVHMAFAPAPEGYSVLIDLDALRLTLYKDGEAFKSWPVSGGKKETPSPTGQWRVSGIGRWGEGFGGSYIALNVPWGKYGIHGTVQPWALGNRNISHGCIRMKNADAGELRKYMSYGTPVYIKHDSAPFRTICDGDTGSDVLSLQEMLRALGYYGGTLDGRYGLGTKAALIEFQKEENVKADGVAGRSAIDLLKSKFSGE